MTKYDILEELIKLFNKSQEYSHFKVALKPFLLEIINSLPKTKVGSKFVTSLNIPIEKGTVAKKSVNIVQDSNGNLIGLISEALTKNGKKFHTTKISPNSKSTTMFNDNGIRETKTSISNVTKDYIEYNSHGTNPVRV